MTKLPEYLEAINKNGKYDNLISLARQGYFHDYKFDDLPNVDYVEPKTHLVAILSNNYPELKDLRKRVINGEFDDRCDEEDKNKLRRDLPPGPFGELLKKKLGL